MALALLAKKGASQRVIWELVARKAIDWLHDRDSSIDWPLLIVQIKDQIA
jgi:hypothetical protein